MKQFVGYTQKKKLQLQQLSDKYINLQQNLPLSFQSIEQIQQIQKMIQTQEDLVSSYLINTKYYDHLRSRLSGILPMQQLKQLIQGVQSIMRFKAIPSSQIFHQPVIVIIIYGEVQYNNKMYGKGEFFQVHDIWKGDSQQKQSIMEQCQEQQQDEYNYKRARFNFLKATTLIFLNLQIMQYRIQQARIIREKMRILEKCMPAKELKLTSSELKKMAKSMDVLSITQKYTQIPVFPGIFILFEGIFEVMYKNITVIEMQNNFLQISDMQQYRIRLKSNNGSYAFLDKESLYHHISHQSINQLDKSKRMRQQFKNLSESKRQYLIQSEELRLKIKQRLRKQKKINSIQKVKSTTFYQSDLATSRKRMLQKCSTAIPGSRNTSLPSSRKTTKSFSVSLRPNQFPTQSSSLFSKTLFDIHNTQQKLDRMRKYENNKSKNKLQKQWYHIQEQKMQTSLGLSYFQIKKSEKSEQQVSKMCNYKRVHRIYSDPCFRKTQTFRTFF